MFVTFFGLTLTHASTLQQCLTKAQKQTHVIDQNQGIESCFRTHKKQLTINSCFSAAQQVNLKKKSIEMNETLSSICFYETTQTNDTKSCVEKAAEFKIAANHDEAVFECYRQFQRYLDLKQCIQLSRQLTYPEKRKHLFQQCQNNH